MPEHFGISRIDFSNCHLPSFEAGDVRGRANELFDVRAAAAVRAGVGDLGSITIPPRSGDIDPNALLERKDHGNAGVEWRLTKKCLAVMAYPDYFNIDQDVAEWLYGLVSEAIMQATPGWCGTYGPHISNLGQPEGDGGDYDMAQMYMLPLAFAYSEELGADAWRYLVGTLLARGLIRRWHLDDKYTSGAVPDDWTRAGVAGRLGWSVPESENHILMIATARYLTNQLLYQQGTHEGHFDNFRHSENDSPTSVKLLVELLRNQLRVGFAEYNAKPYQEQSRNALLNLVAFSYDQDVRLGARMVLDMLSAHYAVSSCDLRRLLPFRRRNEAPYTDTAGSLLDEPGADPIGIRFALHAGNIRAYGRIRYPNSWTARLDFAPDLVLEALSGYRIPPSVHDLLVNDLHRRYFQRLHRFVLHEPPDQNNCDNMEIFAASPSYLITAGGQPATYTSTVHGFGSFTDVGVAMPTSFMPVGETIWDRADTNSAIELIQIGPSGARNADELIPGDCVNYGVAPDFACGAMCHFPSWAAEAVANDGLSFLNMRPTEENRPGFYLAIHRQGDFVTLEAFDTWRRPYVRFEQFQSHVIRANIDLTLRNGEETVYTTFNGNKITFKIWNQTGQEHPIDNYFVGSRILRIEYGSGNDLDTLEGAGDGTDLGPFLKGTILNSILDGYLTITNPYLKTMIMLDWAHRETLVRWAEDNKIERAGGRSHVWVDFLWSGPMEGDFYRPFNRLSDALNVVDDAGVIHILGGGAITERLTIRKRVTLRAMGRR